MSKKTKVPSKTVKAVPAEKSKLEKKQAKLKKKEEKKVRIAQMTPSQRKKRKLKIALIIIGCVIVSLIILYFAGMFILKWLMKKEEIVQPPIDHDTYNFYEAPQDKEAWSLNISEIVEYLHPDNEERKVYASENELKADLYAKFPVLKEYREDYPSELYTYSALSHKPLYYSDNLGGIFPLEDIFEAKVDHEGHRFFEKYFNMLYTGNYEIYPTLFGKNYDPEKAFEKNINREFPPQMIYDITVTELAKADAVVDNQSTIVGLYEVSFLIYGNDGLFRNDIGKNIDLGLDVARPLYFELHTTGAGTGNEKTYINHIYTEDALAAKTEQ
ncbi:MAG: hypothetical protein E7600_05630 [Ruminococcaceae bacterium]|nr:hypothetical protein [Oscillospiraceae bacterium]